MSIYKSQILELRAQGLTYNQIKEKLGCSKAVISYHCNENVRKRSRRNNKIGRWRRGERKLNKQLINGIITSLLASKTQ